jgi:tetratricopeptide (TPR) repeat protein
MSNGKAKIAGAVQPAAAAPPLKPAAPPARVPPLFRPIDWLTFGVTTLLVWVGYFLTLAPDLTLEDSGELAVASYYAGIPHPPGYPVWTIYTWLWTVLLPFKNIAWRVALGEATAGAFACGLLALLVSRGSSMLVEGIAELKNLDRRWENAICIVSGLVAGMLIGFNGYMWSQSVIVEVYSFSVLSLMCVLLGLLRWTYAPHQYRYLYFAFFMYGICFNNHQSLLVIAMGMEALVLFVQPKLAREMFFWNTIAYLGGLVLGSLGYVTLLTSNTPVFVIYNLIGLGSAVLWVWLAVTTKKRMVEIGRDLALVGAIGYAGLVFGLITSYVVPFENMESSSRRLLLFLVHVLGVGLIGLFIWLNRATQTLSKEWRVTLASAGAWIVGAAFYLYMPLAGMTNPPMQWGYPRTVEGFFHAITRGQYERIHPTSGQGQTAFEVFGNFITTYSKQFLMYLDGLDNEFNLICILIVLVVFLFIRSMQRRERAWILGLTGIFVCLGPFLVLLFNPPADRAARELIRVFFTASHTIVAMCVGYGLTLVAAFLAVNYQAARRLAWLGGLLAADLALYSLAVESYSLLGQEALAGSSGFATARFAYGVLCATSFVLVAYRIFTSPSFPKNELPALGILTAVGLACLLVWVLVYNSEEIGVDASTLIGYAKVLVFLVAAVAFFFARHPKRGDDRIVLLAVAGLVVLVSFGLTFVAVLYNQPGLAGLAAFARALSTAFHPGQYALPVFASLILLAIAAVFVVAIFVWRARAPLALTLALFALLPVTSILNHWFENEQRGHLFGYWFGHDMFTPPFTGPDGKFGWYDAQVRAELMKDPAKAKFIYPEMTRNAVLYGGTDPGRFCPTYMIFDESFIPPRCKPRDPHFDRRDVYIITQNALADGTYLNYIRAHYNRSTQIDPPFFQELLRGPKERELGYTTNFLARAAYALLDKPFLTLGAKIEARRRREGVYPPKEIYIATPDDSSRCFNEYLADAGKRAQHDQLHPNEPRQLRPGEGVMYDTNSGRVQVSGQVSVMAINGLITKVMFDHNPTNEFFVEESFPLEWMYPHLTPFGVIMKINREPLAALPEDVLERDHAFWTRYSERLIGNWITYDTPVKEIAEFAEKVYLRRDFSGFKGDRRFVRDDQAQKAFSKLRSSIGGVYFWRVDRNITSTCPPQYRPKTDAEFQRLVKEADFAFRQAFAFCPYSPEAVFRYVQLLTQLNRYEDALIVAETCRKLDPYNGQVLGLVLSLRDTVKRYGEMEQSRASFRKLHDEATQHPTNFQAVINLASAYLALQQTNAATALFDRMLTNPHLNPSAALFLAQYYADTRNWPQLEASLEKLVKLMPDQPETWYDLAALKISLGKQTEALHALAEALSLNAKRRQLNPAATNLLDIVKGDHRFNGVRQLPEFQKLLAPP